MVIRSCSICQTWLCVCPPQVDVRNQRGPHASGKKVTGIRAVPRAPGQYLVTSNDSRLRLLDGYGQVCKYKGHRNASTQIRGELSPYGETLACGSDDGWVYLWDKKCKAADSDKAAGKNPCYQAFQAVEPGVSVPATAFAPVSMYQVNGPPAATLTNAEDTALSGSNAVEGAADTSGDAAMSTAGIGTKLTPYVKDRSLARIGSDKSGAGQLLGSSTDTAMATAGDIIISGRRSTGDNILSSRRSSAEDALCKGSTGVVRHVLVVGGYNSQLKVFELIGAPLAVPDC